MKRIYRFFAAMSAFVILLNASVNSDVVAGIENIQNSNSDSFMQISSTSKISEDVYNEINKGMELIPVFIWYNDINQQNIDTIVQMRTGVSLANLEVEFTEPSTELLEALETASMGNPQEYLNILMKSHMDLTAEARINEKNKTEIYISERRNVLQEQYSKKCSELCSQLQLSESDIVYKSSYAPMIIAQLTPEEIEYISENSNVEAVSLYTELEIMPCGIIDANTRNVMGVEQIVEQLPLTGEGVTIGIYETGTVSTNPSLYASDYGLDCSKVTIIGPEHSAGYHSTWCAAVAAGEDGIAPDALIYSASAEYDWQNFDWQNYSDATLPSLEQLIATNVNIINVSWGFGRSSDYYTTWEKYFDYLIANCKVAIVTATGNVDTNSILGPALAYNTISVNGFNDNNGEFINSYSYINGSGCMKPDLIADSMGNGTSTATPVITGMLALLYEYKPSLAASPHLAKAILLASVHKKITKVLINGNIENLNETLEQGLTDRQGAGLPNMYKMISIVSQHSYGIGVLSGNNGCEENIQIIQPRYNSTNINLSMAYLQTNVTPNTTNGGQDNYDLSLYNSGYSTAKTSSLINSSTELIYTPLSTSSNNYRIKISKISGTGTNIEYAYAWSTNNINFYPTEEYEGMFFLKNKKSNKYLSLNTGTFNTSQTSFSGAVNQQWIINNTSNGYLLQSAYNYGGSLIQGTAMGTNKYRAIIDSSVSNSINIQKNDDGSITFMQMISNTAYALAVYNGSTLSNASISWVPYDSTDNSQKWYIETICYKRGDANMDGSFNNSDSSFVLSMYSDIQVGNNSSYNNANLYLGDMNNDNFITSVDAALILNLVN